MQDLKNLFKGKGYIDGITIINLEGEILFSAKMNKKLGNMEGQDDLLGKKLFDVFQNINTENSSIYRAMQLGYPVYVQDQPLTTIGHGTTLISALSVPIKRGGRVVGAIDLSCTEDSVPEDDRIDLTVDDISAIGKKLITNHDRASFTVEDIVAENAAMRRVRDYVYVVAGTSLPVLIYGETGTGKEVFAQAIHNASARRNMPFIVQNCAALPETLLESILFGTEKGAFTGAVDHKGLFELADGGTLFLDEINSMPISLQAKILRVIQDGSFRHLGGKDTLAADVRIIAAMNTEPFETIQKGQMRQDLYYRLSMMQINIPPLRERKEDIAVFVRRYISKHNATFGKHVKYISAGLMRKLQEYPWPGNVRELENLIVYGMSMVSREDETLRLSDVSARLEEMRKLGLRTLKENREAGEDAQGQETLPLREAVENYEKQVIQKALETSGGNVTEAARILEVPRATLQRRVQQFHLAQGKQETP